MRTLLAAALLLTVLLAGCSGGGDRSVVPPMDGEGQYTIRATSGNTFSPPHASVPVGATVVWVSEGVHDVVADDDSFTSYDGTRTGPLGNGERFAHTFAEPGVHTYMCHLHSGMKGKVTVA